MRFINENQKQFNKTLKEIFYRTVLQVPCQEALIHESERITYKELCVQVEGLSLYLIQKCGIQKGDRIAIILPNCKEFVIAYYATVIIGAVAVPLNVKLTGQEIREQLIDSLPRTLIVGENFFHLVEESIDRMQILKHTILVSREDERFDIKSLPQEQSDALAEVKVYSNDLACILYTSGTTGRPKGAVMTHWNIAFGSQIIRIPQSYKYLNSVPLFHVAGLNSCLNTCVANSGSVMLVEKFKVDEVLPLVESERIDFITVVPTILTMMVNSPEIEGVDVSSIKVIACGGAPLHLELLKKALNVFPGASFLQMFAMTETTNRVFCMECNKNKRKLASIGRALPGFQTKIVDEGRNELHKNKTGELVIKGPSIIEKYWNQPELTKETIVDGWLYTGDLAKVDDEGYHYIMGRKKDMIIRGGENIYNIEVENVVREHPKVIEAAVFGIPDDFYGEEIMTFVVLEEGKSLSVEELREFCSKRLAEYKIPRYLRCLKELPKNPTGKVLKEALFAENTSARLF